MNLQHYFYLLLRYSWLIILLAAAALSGAWVWLGKQAPVYASRAVLQVEMEQTKVVKIEDVQDTRITGLDALNTVIQNLTSNTIMLAVARSTGLADEMAALEPTGKIPPEKEATLAEMVKKDLTVSLRRGTRLIDIVAEGSSPEKARLLADQVVKQFLISQNQDRSEVSQDAQTFLVNEAKKLKAKLEESERSLAKYRLDTNSVSVNDQQNTVVQRLQALNAQVTLANGQRASLESDLAALKLIKPGDVEGMLKLNSVAALPDVAQLRSLVSTGEAEFARIKERYLELHPKYGAALSGLNELKSKLKSAVASAGDTLRQQYQSFSETEQKLKDMLAEQEKKTLELDAISIPYKVLQREADTDRTLYETILARLKETDVTAGLTKTPYRFTEEPLLIPDPVRPNKIKTMALAGLLALAAGWALILLLDRLDSSIRTVDEAESILQQPVLAAVPEGNLEKIPEGAVAMTHDSGSAQAEAFRTLRASLSLLGAEDQRRLILVTSAIPSEGKTFTSTNLSAAFATQGLNTIVIDADLRRPSLSATLLDREVRKSGEFRGLTDVLSGLCSIEEAIRPTTVPNLSLLPSGRRAPNPAELLAQINVGQLLESLLKKYDRVVVDSAPVNAVSDTLSLASMAHAVCLVLRFGKTPRRAILRALTLLEKTGARMAGIVMNRMPTSRGASYYYYYYGDPDVADSVYGAPNKKKKSAKAEV
jgi:capsular exopolysaccharide synthesis family protein